MAESKKGKQLFTVGRVFFLMIVIPLSLMAVLVANGIFQLGVTVKEGTANILDQKVQEEIKVRAIDTADEIANFLRERQKDLLVATIIPATDASYRQFVRENRKPLWTKVDGQITSFAAYLYREMTLTDRMGNEMIKIVNGEVIPKTQLSHVNKPADGDVTKKICFDAAKGLGRGEVTLSRVTGRYINRNDFEQGKRFSGFIRLSTPVFNQQGFSGVLSLAIDYRHLASFTDHVIPTQSGHVYEADAAKGNYAYLVDDRGFVISHPYDYHVAGQYPDGSSVPALTEEKATLQAQKGEAVLNLYELGFLDPNLPLIAQDASAGNAGAKLYESGGRTTLVAYAPIKFFTKDTPPPGGFGWVGMVVDVELYNTHTLAASQHIEKETKAWTKTILVILTASVILLFLILALLARGITRSIETEVPEEAIEAATLYDDDEEENT